MPCPPELVNYLVVEVSNSQDFTNAETLILPPETPSFPVNGTAGTSRWVRSKWRRSNDPLEESGWSNELRLNFPRIQAYEIDSGTLPGTSSFPQVPVIRSVLGWSEFIELILIANQQGEGCEVGYGVGLMATGRSWIWVKNTSTDPSISIVEAALIIGQPFPQIDCHGDKTIAAGFHPNDDFLAASGSIDDVSNYGPYIADPPVADIDVASGQIKYYGTPVTPPEGVDPGNPDYACLSERCPEPGDPGYNSQFKCINVFDVARTPDDFNLPGGGNYYVRVDAGIARAFAVYVHALGHTIFPPFLNVSIGTGHFAGFTQVGSVYVRFSTGFATYQPAVDLGPQLGGIIISPDVRPSDLQLDDFFVFISEAPFAADLSGTGGRWENAVLENDLPDGVFLAMISRSTNHLVSNIGGVPLDPPKTQEDWPEYTKGYYFRVGARRFQNLAQTEFLYSETLSEQAFGRLGTAARLNEALGLGTAEGIVNANPWKSPVATVDDLPSGAEVGDTRLVLDEGIIYSYISGLWQRTAVPTLKVVGEILWGTGTVALGLGGFKPSVPKNIVNGVLIGWCLKCDVAGNGSTIVDIHKNGTTIFTNQANRPTLFNGQTKNTGSTIDVTGISSEDDLELFYDAVPGTVPQKVTAILYFRQDTSST